jgi:hypothetical protein
VGLLSVSFTAFAQSNNDMTQEQSQHDNMTHDDNMKHDDGMKQGDKPNQN